MYEKHKIVPLIAIALIAVACGSSVPQADVDAANAALETASADDASVYAPEAYTAAQDAKNALDAEMKAQAGSFSAFRSYTKATELAASAKSAAEKAGQEAAAGKEAARNDATTIIADARTTLTEARALLSKAPRGKGTQADLAALNADLLGAEMMLAQAETELGAGRYNEAKVKAEASKTASAGVATAVQGAMAARKGRPV